MPDQRTPELIDDSPITDWLRQGRCLLESFEEQARTHQEIADDYRAQAHRLRQGLAGVKGGDDG